MSWTLNKVLKTLVAGNETLTATLMERLKADEAKLKGAVQAPNAATLISLVAERGAVKPEADDEVAKAWADYRVLNYTWAIRVVRKALEEQGAPADVLAIGKPVRTPPPPRAKKAAAAAEAPAKVLSPEQQRVKELMGERVLTQDQAIELKKLQAKLAKEQAKLDEAAAKAAAERAALKHPEPATAEEPKAKKQKQPKAASSKKQKTA